MRRKKKNIILEKLLVEDYAAGGKSLAKVDGKVIFIENVVPGDVVDVRLMKNKKDWAEGVPIHTHSLSADRVTPFCSHFSVCGGCQWQMLPYEKQLQYKHKQVEETLKRIGKVALPECLPILGAAETRHYRNKVEYTFGNKRYLLKEELTDESVNGQQDVAGFHAKGFFDKVVDIKECFLQAEPTNAIRLAVKELGIKNNWPFYDIRNHTGFLRTMQVRLCTTRELMVNIVVAENDEQKIKLLMETIAKQFPEITTLLYTVNTKWNDSMFDLEPVVYHGKGYVIEKLEDFQFKIGPKSFFQTNTKQGEQLYKVTRDFAELTGNETVYDLYCGTGSIGIFVSKLAKKIIGVEMIEAAIEDAKENATLNNLSSAAFFAGDVIDICNDEFFAEHGKPDVIITDPPRAGMHEKLVKKILDMAAPTVVYVSCNPATQARDLLLLDEKYIVAKVQPVDMFPHTHHIENVVQLKLR
ncbi:MAG: 23S rRNA (uracil(1939)-C(5))-methyltransferase RlmD [Chitinophagaceae bacterium]|nr:23S rRNA (uracil(1939)-C(5))-methyltransferase RlmD [Chitinophagaceae bacterium]MBP9104278.1 23S rRNA (uracil(1939)-C(5))-methyltransferase RlmD [Chitinophagaceae bacterium]